MTTSTPMSSSPPSQMSREETIPSASASPPPPTTTTTSSRHSPATAASEPPRTDTDNNSTIISDSDAHGLAIALEEAERGRAEGGIPIGSALLARSGERLGAGHNLRVQRGSPTLHAEIAALEHAGRLSAAVYRDCTLVSFSLFSSSSSSNQLDVCVPPRGCFYTVFSVSRAFGVVHDT
jgi:Cytidine and deoxycytidylate deaminase zinc-binding region